MRATSWTLHSTRREIEKEKHRVAQRESEKITTGPNTKQRKPGPDRENDQEKTTWTVSIV